MCHTIKGWRVIEKSVRLFFSFILMFSTVFFGFRTTFYSLGGHPLRMRLTPYGLLVIDSLKGYAKLLENGEVLVDIESLDFPVWADLCCGGIYISDLKKSRILLWKDGRVLKWARVPRPEMVKVKDNRIFVSSGKIVYVFDKDLNLLKKMIFPSSSVYFYIGDDRIIHLEYWGKHPDITIASLFGKYRESLDFGLSKPFRYEELNGRKLILDYMGKLVVLRGGMKKILRVGRYSYGMAISENSVFVSSLVEKFVRKIDLETLHQRFIKTPSPIGDMEYCCGDLIMCGIFADEVYIYDGKSLKTIRGCDYPLMVESDPPYVYVLCSDSGKVLKIDFSK